MIELLYVAFYLYVGLLFAEVLRKGYIEAGIKTTVKRDYILVLLFWLVLISIIVYRNWHTGEKS